MYVKVVDGSVARYPYNLDQLRDDNPNTSFPVSIELDAEMLSTYGVYKVQSTALPTYDDKTQRLTEVYPTLVDGVWTRSYQVVELTDQEKNEIIEIKSQEVRSQRNILLMQSDWTQLPDTPANSAAWAVYRQALRDVTTQVGYPFTVIWPTQPE